MATPMTADQFLAALKAEGVKVTEHAGWRDHNRNCRACNRDRAAAAYARKVAA